MSLVVVGAFSFVSLGVDLFPKIDFPTITVTVVNPGASPQEIETEITEKIEEAVNTISGIDELRSTSVEGISQVFVQFVLEKDVNVAAQEVENRVQTVIPNLPETAEQPTVQKLDTDAAPGPAYRRLGADAASRGHRDCEEQDQGAHRIGQRRRPDHDDRRPGTADQRLGRSRQDAFVQRDAGRGLGCAAGSRTWNFRAAASTKARRKRAVRTLGKIQKPEEFNDVVVATRGSYQVKVKDLGYTEDGARGGPLRGAPERPARGDADRFETVGTEHRRRRARDQGASEGDRADAAERISRCGSSATTRSLSRIRCTRSRSTLIVGSILAAIVVFLFLWNFRSTFIAALAIPTSIISTFALMYAMGYTLNSITMLSLTLMVGIVIDDAIVVLENIYRFVEEKGMNPFQAAIEGTREIGLAVLATTLSLMAVFVPIGFMQGIVGKFMSSFGLTASFAVGVSLIVSFTLTPMLAARLIKRKKSKQSGVRG